MISFFLFKYIGPHQLLSETEPEETGEGEPMPRPYAVLKRTKSTVSRPQMSAFNCGQNGNFA